MFKKDCGFDDFISTLKREKSPPTQAMLDGRQYESMISAALAGNEPASDHKWHNAIVYAADVLRGSAEQVKASCDVTINGIEFVLYGILDNLRAGVIYDTKMSKSYSFGKYKDSTQHPMYFRLVPEAYKFSYIIFNGKDTFVEDYYRDDVIPIDNTINQFMMWLDKHNLVDLYCKNWRSMY